MHPFRLILAVAASIVAAKQYRALVHRGPGDCKGCPEAVGWLLESSDYKFQVTYAGVAEDVQITAESLGRVDVYAHGGGPGTYLFCFVLLIVYLSYTPLWCPFFFSPVILSRVLVPEYPLPVYPLNLFQTRRTGSIFEIKEYEKKQIV